MAAQAAVKPKAEQQENAAGKESQSFTMNLFRGQLQLNQVFPFPEPLNEDQTDTLKLLVDPVEKFYEVIIFPNGAMIEYTYVINIYRSYCFSIGNKRCG